MNATFIASFILIVAADFKPSLSYDVGEHIKNTVREIRSQKSEGIYPALDTPYLFEEFRV